MKRLVFITTICLNLSFGLVPLAKATIAQEAQWLSTCYHLAARLFLGSDAASRDLQVQHSGGHRRDQSIVTPQQCETAQSSQSLPFLLVQAMGSTCITPSGRCSLPNPAPINSSCCCSFACGYVGP